MANKINKDEPDSLDGLISSAVRGLITGIITALLLALILSAVALGMDDPSSLLGIFALAALFIGAFADGIAASKAYPDGGLLAGIFGGAVYVLLIWVISLFFRGKAGASEAVSPLGIALGYAGCVAFAALGGLLGRPKRRNYGEGKKSPSAMARKQFKTSRR